MKKLLIPFTLLLISGCATTVVEEPNVREDSIVEWNSDEEREIDKSEGVPIPSADHVIVADKDGILIEVHLIDSEFGDDPTLEQQRWAVYMTNVSPHDRCVGVSWHLMDFEYVTEEPHLIFSEAESMSRIGEMLQVVWEIDGVKFAPEASGYVYDLIIVNPNQNARDEAEKCLFLVNEDDIRTEEDVIPEEDIIER